MQAPMNRGIILAPCLSSTTDARHPGGNSQRGSTWATGGIGLGNGAITPPEGLYLVSPYFPVLDKIDLHVRVRFIERHVIDKANPMHTTHGSVMPLVRCDTPGVLRRLYLREQIGMIAFFDPKHIAQMVVVQGLNVRGLGTQALFHHDKLEV